MLHHALRAAIKNVVPLFVGGYTTSNAVNASTYNVPLDSLTGGLAAAPRAGDLVLIVTAIGGSTDLNARVTTSGYTELRGDFQGAGKATGVAIAYKIADGSETAVTVAASLNATIGKSTTLQVWRNVNSAQPFDVTTTKTSGTGAVVIDSPTLTPVTAGSVILSCGASSSLSPAPTAPSGFSLAFSSAAPVAFYGCCTALAVAPAWTSGSYDPPAWTGGSTPGPTDSWIGYTLALRPA